MRIALTGASGIVGRTLSAQLIAEGHAVTPLGRVQGWTLGQAADLGGHDALIHAAFAHVPGRYRGGEGDDPAGFVAANLDGTRRLFDEALAQGVGRVVFLSSRAVHDGHPAGLPLPDDLPARPTTLYGKVKAEAEAHLAALPLVGTSIRATGIYGPGPAWKWDPLIRDYLAGRPIAPRIATEVHAADLARAALILLTHPEVPATVNCSDLVLDRHDLLSGVARLTGCPHPPPGRADPAGLRIPECRALHAMGWRPGGAALLQSTLADRLAQLRGI